MLQDWVKNRTVALVGNAQSLFDHAHGQLIDGNDVVCRLNRGIIIQRALSQGNRTDLWAVGHPKFVNDIIDQYPCKCLIHVSSKGRHNPDPRVDFYIPMDLINTLCHDLGHAKPSTGLAMICAILDAGPKCLTLYGFDWKKTPTWYFKQGAYQPHDWLLEKNFVYSQYVSKSMVQVI